MAEGDAQCFHLSRQKFTLVNPTENQLIKLRSVHSSCSLVNEPHIFQARIYDEQFAIMCVNIFIYVCQHLVALGIRENMNNLFNACWYIFSPLRKICFWFYILIFPRFYKFTCMCMLDSMLLQTVGGSFHECRDVSLPGFLRASFSRRFIVDPIALLLRFYVFSLNN